MQFCNEKRRLFLRTAITLMIGPAAAWAGEKSSFELRLFPGESNDSTPEILKAFSVHFPTARVINSINNIDDRRGGLINVALGAAALQTLLDASFSTPVLSLFTSNEAYTRVVGNSHKPSENLCAIYAEANPSHQLQLLRALYKRRIGVVVLLTAGTVHLQQIIEQAAHVNDLELHVRLVEPGDSVFRAMLSQRDAKAVLMIPDRALYTAKNLRSVLESAYRNQLGVIGFSPSLVRAGALAAAYSSVDSVISQIRPIAEAMAIGRSVPPQYPSYWRVLINDRVANSLDVVVDDSDRRLGS